MDIDIFGDEIILSDNDNKEVPKYEESNKEKEQSEEQLEETVDYAKLTKFSLLGVYEPLVRALANVKIFVPTLIQRMVLYNVMAQNKSQKPDILGVSATGSGKTICFALPIIQDCCQNPYGIFALILVPSRELASQIHEQFSAYGNPLGINSKCLIGGMPIGLQQEILESRPHVLIATPGVLAYLLKSDFDGERTLGLSRLKYLVLDEVDRLLTGEQDITEQMEMILKKLPPPGQRRLMMFTATANDTVRYFIERRKETKAPAIKAFIIEPNNEQDDCNSICNENDDIKSNFVVNWNPNLKHRYLLIPEPTYKTVWLIWFLAITMGLQVVSRSDGLDYKQEYKKERQKMMEQAVGLVGTFEYDKVSNSSGISEKHINQKKNSMKNKNRGPAKFNSDKELNFALDTLNELNQKNGIVTKETDNIINEKKFMEDMILQTDKVDSKDETIKQVELDDINPTKVRSAIIFVESCRMAAELELVLKEMPQFEKIVTALHSAMAQVARNESITRFRSGQARILVATDVASRGLDIPTVDLVIHYNMPKYADEYIHRSGRTARAGNSGLSVALLDFSDIDRVDLIKATLDSTSSEFDFREITTMRDYTNNSRVFSPSEELVMKSYVQNVSTCQRKARMKMISYDIEDQLLKRKERRKAFKNNIVFSQNSNDKIEYIEDKSKNKISF